MKRILLLMLLMTLLCTATAVCAAPETDRQIELIAQYKDLWKQDIEFGTWGYTITDLDHNGRLEVISASVQGTGFYTYILAYEVNAEGNGMTELYGPENLNYDSAPDIMVSTVPVFHDKRENLYYYIFDDMIRSSMSEYYENKRTVSIVEGTWQETPLAYKTTIYTDAEHYSISCTDANQNPISEAQFSSIAESIFSGLEKGEAEFKWIMTDSESFNTLNQNQLIESLKELGVRSLK